MSARSLLPPPRFYFACETCELPPRKILWHLLSDIYLAADYSTHGGGGGGGVINNQRAFHLREEEKILTYNDTGTERYGCACMCVRVCARVCVCEEL